VVPYPPGGPADRCAARLIAAPLSSKLGQTVVIENQSGAGGRIWYQSRRLLPGPDGYTLQLGWYQSQCHRQIAFTATLDFDPASRTLPQLLLSRSIATRWSINPNVPAKTLQ